MSALRETVQATRDVVEQPGRNDYNHSHKESLTRLREQILVALQGIEKAIPSNRIPTVRKEREKPLFKATNWLRSLHDQAAVNIQERSLSLLPLDMGPLVDKAILHYPADDFHTTTIAQHATLRAIRDSSPLLDPDVEGLFQKMASVDLCLVGIPTTELENSLAWGLLFHEYMHTTDVPASIYIHSGLSARKAFASEMWDCKDEVMTDLAALLVLGPAYAVALAEAPEKFGRAPGQHHPSADFRFWFAKQVLEATNRLLSSSSKSNKLARELCQRALQHLPPSNLNGDEKRFQDEVGASIGEWVKVGRDQITSLGGSTWDAAMKDWLSYPNYYGWLSPQEIAKGVPDLLKSGVLPAAPPRTALNLALLALRSGKPPTGVSKRMFTSAIASAFARGSVAHAVAHGPITVSQAS